MCRATRLQAFGRGGSERVPPRSQRIAHGSLGREAITAGLAGFDVRLDAGVRVLRGPSIGVRTQQRFDLTTLVHAAPAFTFDSRSNNIRRPLEILDMTVPIGTSIMLAISAYENSSTSRNQTACLNASGRSSSAA